MGNLEQLAPIISEGIRWIMDKAGPSKKDLQLQMSDLEQQVHLLMAQRGMDLAYQKVVIDEILNKLKQSQTTWNFSINANNVYINYISPEHMCMSKPTFLDERGSWIVPLEGRQVESLTSDRSYLKTRASVVYRHLEVLLSCSRITKSDFKTLFDAAEKEELYTAGVYLENCDQRIFEVEISIDWTEHHRMKATEGVYLYTNLPGWQRGVSPEVYAITNRILGAATRMGKPIYAWFSTLKSPASGKDNCKKTVYYFERKVPPWTVSPSEKHFTIGELQEIIITTRIA